MKITQEDFHRTGGAARGPSRDGQGGRRWSQSGSSAAWSKRRFQPGIDRDSRPDPLRLVYIIGAARSGSTLLDTLLGASADVESVGELCNAVRYGWLGGGYCACGRLVCECEFWNQVLRHWCRRLGGPRLTAYEGLLRRVEMSRWWWARRRQDMAQRPWFRRYAEWTRWLLEAIQHTSGRPVIVDSSKLRARGWALSAAGEIDLRLVHLVRDVRGVAWSIKKRLRPDARGGLPKGTRPRPAWRTAAGWAWANLLAERVCRAVGTERFVRLRYEDLVTDPARVLAGMGKLIGVDLGPVAEAVAAGAPVPVGHTVAGNRMRMAGRVRLAGDWQWQQKLPAADRWLCWAIAGWLMRRYGYHWKTAGGQTDRAGHAREAAA